MSITQLTIKDWKGESAKVDLAELTAFRGRSGSGKSGRLSALMFGFMGHCGDGKTNEAVADYAGPMGTSVGIEIDAGFSFERGLRPTEGGGWSETVSIAGAKKMGVEKARGEIRSKFGDFSVALNPDEIVAMKPEASRDFILDLCQSSNEYDPDTICRLILLELLYQHSSVGEQTAKTYLELGCQATPESCTLEHIHTLSKKYLSAREHESLGEIAKLILKAMKSPGDGTNERVSAVLDAVEEFVKLAKTAEREGREAGVALLQQKNQADAVPGDIEKIESELVQLREQEVALERRIATQAEANKHADTIRTRLDEIALQLAEAEAVTNQERAPGIDVEAANRERDQLAEGVDRKLVEEDQLSEQIEKLEAKLRASTEARHEAELAIQRRQAIKDRIAELEPLVGEDSKKLATETRTADEIEAAAKAATPDNTEMDRLIAARDRIKGEITTATEQQRQLDIRRNEAQAALKQSEHLATTNQAKLDAITTSPAIQMHDALCDQCKAATAGLIAGESARRDELTGAMVEFRAHVATDRETLSAIDSEAAAIREKIAGLESEKSDAQSSIDKLARERESALGRVNTLNRLAELRRNADARAAELQAKSDALNAFPSDLDKQLTDLAATIGSCDAELITAKARANELSTEIESVKSRLRDLRQSIEAEAKAAADFTRRKAELSVTIGRLAADKADTEARLKAVISESPNITIESMQTELAGVRSQISQTEERMREKQAYLDLERNYAETIAKAEAKRTAHEIGTMAVAAIKKVREFLMVELTKPVTAKMTEFLEQYESGIEAFITLTKTTGKGSAVFKIGWLKDGRRVSIKTVAGGERVVLIAALSYAVTLLKDPPLKLMLVDACTATPDVLEKLIKALEWAAPQFGNIVMAVHPTCPREAFSDHWLVNDLDPVNRSNANETESAEAAATAA